MSITQLVTSGPLILALPVAAAAGAVTFLSPCCLPLVPGYLSFVTGMAGASGRATDSPAPASAAGAAGPGVAVAARRPVAVATAAPAVTGVPAGAGAGASAGAGAPGVAGAPGLAGAPRGRAVAG